MRKLNQAIVKGWQELGPRFLPFADAVTPELPAGRLLRLSLLQLPLHQPQQVRTLQLEPQQSRLTSI